MNQSAPKHNKKLANTWFSTRRKNIEQLSKVIPWMCSEQQEIRFCTNFKLNSMFREEFVLTCQDLFKHLGPIYVDSPKTLASKFPKAHLTPSLQIWYIWVDLEHQVRVGRHNHPPPHIDARHTQDLFCRCGFPISHHHRTPGEAVGAIMERNLGEESTITNVSGLTLATRWHHITSYKLMFWDYYPKAIKRGWKEKCRIIKLWNNNEKITL